MTRLGVTRALVDGVLVDGDVEVVDGRIAAVGLAGEASAGGLAAPGFIDLQVNGFAGVDLLSADATGYAAVSAALAATGVTSYLPTFITSEVPNTEAALAELAAVMRLPEGDRGASRKQPGARPLGAHLEGPFLSERQAGTHPIARLRAPDRGIMDRLLSAGPVAYVTLAPELPGALAMVRHLVSSGVVVACGHTDADAAQGHAAFDHGATAVTHLFNAMRPFRHRDPGIAGVALTRDEVSVGVIADGIHLAAETLHLAWLAAGARLVLVTDATAAAGMPDGDFSLGEVALTKAGLEVRRSDGTLAGSALTMDAAVRTAVEAGVPLAAALHAATRAPADLLGRSDLGRLTPGSVADVAVLDDELNITQVLCAGQEIA